MTYHKPDQYQLSTGRVFYAHRGIIGLTPESETGRTFEGSDGDLDLRSWTRAERAELADWMIAQWTVFKRVGR
jgi:hypothetical protein